MKHFSVLFAAALVAAAVVPALADHSASAADRQFVMNAAAGGTAEVREGKAQSKSTNGDARMFGQRMVRDHSKANAQLKLLAQETGLTAVFQKGAAHAPETTESMPPKQYLAHEVSDHQTTIALFESEAANGKIPSLRAYAKMTLPTLRAHLELAQRLSGTP